MAKRPNNSTQSSKFSAFIPTSRYVDPKTDFSFKHFFGKEPHKDLLTDFLNGLFKDHKAIEELSHAKHIGNNIRSIRQLKGIKQEMLAEKLGVKQQSVSKMEKKKTLTNDQLESVAKILNVTTDLMKNFDERVVVNNSFFFNDQINILLKEIIGYFKGEVAKRDVEIARLKIELGEYRI